MKLKNEELRSLSKDLKSFFKKHGIYTLYDTKVWFAKNLINGIYKDIFSLRISAGYHSDDSLKKEITINFIDENIKKF